MKPLPLVAVLTLVAGCRNPDPSEVDAARGAFPSPNGPSPIVTGTVLEARTGRPVAGARVRGPGGVEATSDAQGRFVLRGLHLGASGELVGTSKAAGQGRNVLRELEGGPLEVVLYLR